MKDKINKNDKVKKNPKTLIETIKSGDFYLDRLENLKITDDDIKEFFNTYKKVLELETEYNNSLLERRKIALEIEHELSTIKTFMWIFDNKINELYTDYKSKANKNFVTDYKLALKLILKLANNREEKYIIKPFYSSDFISPETKHGDKDFAIQKGTTLIIGNKNILDSLDNSKIYYGSKLNEITHKLVKDGNSLIITTNNYFDTNVKPGSGLKIFENINVLEFNIEIDDFDFSDISCYLFDDELRSAVSKFMNFIEENGPDIKGLNEEELFKIINKKGRQKTLLKK